MTRTTPSIRISQPSGQRNSPDSCGQSSHPLATTVLPMAIPRAREAVPPPLPPPQYLPEISTGRDPGWQWANDPSASDFARPTPVKPGSSLLGSFYRSPSQERDDAARVEDHVRRTSSTSTITPSVKEVVMADAQSEEDSSTSRPPSDHRLQSERRLERTAFEGSSHAYDKQLLSRIGGPNTPNKALSGPGIQDVTMSDRERRNSLLPALGQSHDGSRWLPSVTSSGAISPHIWEGSHTRHNSIQSEGLSARSYDHHHEDFPMDDAQQSREDVFGNFKIGAKRRASSPPRDLSSREERHSLGSASHMSEAQRRANQQVSREGAPPRFHPNHASVSSVSSYGAPRHGSLGSSLGISSVPSSATSYASGVSPLVGIENETKNSAPLHQRSISEATQTDKRSPASPDRSQQGSRSQGGPFVCECCPRKFKKFDTEEELRAHESEKQYGCLYCSNRFKNKNEAERHQNSLHLRRHSWSCAALAGYEAAFHASTSGTDVDICGYCGDEFQSPADWELRIQHLTNNHKFGQCNQSKKFFRADHFRQHLKHSHDGTSGKWTNMLENACMKDEPPPVKLSDATSSPFTSNNEYTNQRT